MPDILDAAQKQIDSAVQTVAPGAGTPPVSPAQPSSPPPVEEKPATPVPAPPAPPSPTEAESKLVDTIIQTAEKNQSHVTPPVTGQQAPPPPAAAPASETPVSMPKPDAPHNTGPTPPKLKKKGSPVGIILASLLLALFLPVGLYFMSYQSKLRDLRSKAANPGDCVCVSGWGTCWEEIDGNYDWRSKGPTHPVCGGGAPPPPSEPAPTQPPSGGGGASCGWGPDGSTACSSATQCVKCENGRGVVVDRSQCSGICGTGGGGTGGGGTTPAPTQPPSGGGDTGGGGSGGSIPIGGSPGTPQANSWDQLDAATKQIFIDTWGANAQAQWEAERGFYASQPPEERAKMDSDPNYYQQQVLQEGLYNVYPNIAQGGGTGGGGTGDISSCLGVAASYGATDCLNQPEQNGCQQERECLQTKTGQLGTGLCAGKSLAECIALGGGSGCTVQVCTGTQTNGEFTNCTQGGGSTGGCGQVDVYCGNQHGFFWDKTACGGGGGGGGGGGETTTTTTGTAPQCSRIRVYKGTTQLDAAGLAGLKQGDIVTLAVAGANATQGRIRVNGGTWNTTTTKNASDEFTVDFTIPASVTSFTIEAEVFGNGVWK